MTAKISPKAFFFDFDGVICDSEKAHMLSTLKVAGEFNINFTEDYYFEKLFGFDDKGLFKHLFEKQNIDLNPETLSRLIKEKNQKFMGIIEEHVIFFDGVKNLMERLHQHNVPMAVVSGALSSEVQACLDKGQLSHYFRFIVCADQVKNSKPDPECYEVAFSKMQEFLPDLKKQDVWVLEDSPTGLNSALDADLKVIGITNSTHRIVLSKAHHIIKHYDEIELLD